MIYKDSGTPHVIIRPSEGLNSLKNLLKVFFLWITVWYSFAHNISLLGILSINPFRSLCVCRKSVVSPKSINSLWKASYLCKKNYLR